MSRMEIEAKLQEIKDKEAFAVELEKAATPDEMVAVLKEYGVDTTVEELEEEILPVVMEESSVELNEEELENVAGGCSCGGKLQHWVRNAVSWLVNKVAGRETSTPCRG